MENRFDDNEFEHFLHDETKQHRMYPSEKIWRNIHKELHPPKAWPALTFISLFIISLLTISTILNNHPAQPFFNISANTASQEKITSDKKEKVEYTAELFAKNITLETFSLIKAKAKEEELQAFVDLIAAENPSVAIVPNIAKAEIVLYEPNVPEERKIAEGADRELANNGNAVEKEIKKRLDSKLAVSSYIIESISTTTEAAPSFSQGTTGLVKNNTLSTSAELQKTAKKNSLFKKPVDDNPTEVDYNAYQVPSLTKKKASKFEYQFYITPSISYRKLEDDKKRNDYQRSSTATTGPTALNYTVNVNDVVRHKPAMGTEVGFGAMYKLTKSLKLKTGFQFNVRQYYIDAFSNSTGLATIAIVSNDRLDTITQYSNFSNTNGYKESQLDNKLYQVSVPIGLQWDFLQTKHLGLSIGGSLQPTVTLNKTLYIISTDYKVYTDGTPFLRRWNINSSAELDITYKVGKVKWYLGPQIRYQHLPTYTDKYPIKEYRLDYGLKIGFTKSL